MSPAGALALRRPFLLHCLVILAAWLTYLIDPTDVVWRCIRNAPHSRILEHIAFALAAVLIGIGILLGSWRTDRDYAPQGWSPGSIRRRCAGEILHSIGLACLLPLPGFLMLIAGETIRSLQYARLKMRLAQQAHGPWMQDLSAPSWKLLALSQSFAWGAFVSMAIFSIVLVDSVADYLFAATILLAIVTRARLPRESFVVAQ